MNLVKTAFVHGLQRSLVSSGAMPPYSSDLHMKIAANYALKKLALKEKEEGKNISQNKKLKLTDNYELERDKGTRQWKHHDVLAGVDFVIWNPKKGIDSDSQKVFHRPIVWDAFCSVVRVFDNENVFMLGGNLEPKHGAPDTQNITSIVVCLGVSSTLSWGCLAICLAEWLLGVRVLDG